MPRISFEPTLLAILFMMAKVTIVGYTFIGVQAFIIIIAWVASNSTEVTHIFAYAGFLPAVGAAVLAWVLTSKVADRIKEINENVRDAEGN